jgi:hypothetical protein
MPLSNYGTSIRSYQGTGTLHLHSGAVLACSYEAGQFSDGEVLVLSGSSADVWESDTADRFTGQTANGWTVQAELDIPINVLGHEPDLPPGTYFAHRALRLRATPPVSARATMHRYGIVNFRFFGTNAFTALDVAGNPVRHGWRLHLQLPDTRGPIDVSVEPVVGYSSVATELSTLRGIAVTCEAVIDVDSLPAGVHADAVLDDLCLLLSVARGTRVQWLYRRDLDASGCEVAVTHVSHITRRYQGLEPIDHRAQAREHTKRFLEGAYGSLPTAGSTYELRHALIPAYIDGRSEDDFLQMRGVKLAVVAEMIKAQHSGDAGGRRPTFQAALSAAFGAAGFHPTDDDLRDFVASRNRLVHAGRFRADPIFPQASRFADAGAEYFFMLTFLDRFFLKLLGYRGPFLDWSRYPEHELGTLS